MGIKLYESIDRYINKYGRWEVLKFQALVEGQLGIINWPGG